MTQHTPGPWFPHIDKNGRPSVTAGGVERIADCWHTAAGDGNANARLIAAAPDLLAALEELVDMAQRCDSWESFPSPPIEKANAAIAKATGSAA